MEYAVILLLLKKRRKPRRTIDEGRNYGIVLYALEWPTLHSNLLNKMDQDLWICSTKVLVQKSLFSLHTMLANKVGILY